MTKSTIAVSIALALAVNGVAWAQADVSVQPVTGSTLAVKSLPAHWEIVVSDSLPGSHAFLFAGFSPGSWQIFYALPAGSITLDVLDPIAFEIGLTDADGVLKTPFAKPATLEPWMQGLTVYSQVLCVQLNPTRGSSGVTSQPTVAFDKTGVVPIVLEQAAFDG